MAAYNIGDTSLILANIAINDFAEGDFIVIEPVNEKNSIKNGANGNVTKIPRMDGDVHNLKVAVIKYSDSDVFLNSEVNSNSRFLNGTLKSEFTRDGADFTETWKLRNGSILTQPTHTYNNQDGNVMIEYTIQFRSAIRQL